GEFSVFSNSDYHLVHFCGLLSERHATCRSSAYGCKLVSGGDVVQYSLNFGKYRPCLDDAHEKSALKRLSRTCLLFPAFSIQRMVLLRLHGIACRFHPFVRSRQPESISIVYDGLHSSVSSVGVVV